MMMEVLKLMNMDFILKIFKKIFISNILFTYFYLIIKMFNNLFNNVVKNIYYIKKLIILKKILKLINHY